MSRRLMPIIIVFASILLSAESSDANPIYLDARLERNIEVTPLFLSEDILDVAYSRELSKTFILSREDRAYQVRELNARGKVRWRQRFPSGVIPFSYLYWRNGVVRCLASRRLLDGERVGVEVSFDASRVEVQEYPGSGVGFQHAFAPRREDRVQQILAAAQLRPVVYPSPPGSVLDSGTPWAFPVNALYLEAFRIAWSMRLDTVVIASLPLIDVEIAQTERDGYVRRDALAVDGWLAAMQPPVEGTARVITISAQRAKIAIGVVYGSSVGVEYRVLGARRSGGEWSLGTPRDGLVARVLERY